MENTIKAFIPFSGFYNSVWSEAIDSVIEREVDYHEYDEYDDDTDYQTLRTELAKIYLDEFIDWVLDEVFTPMTFDLEFEELKSPREYNFETDTILVKMSPATAHHILAKLHYSDLEDKVDEECTSDPDGGFISFVPSDVNEWFETPIDKWRPAQWELVLRVFLEDEEMDYTSLEREVVDGVRVWEKIEEYVVIKPRLEN